MINVTLDGKTYQTAKGSTVGEFVEENFGGEKFDIVLATVDGKLCELSKKLIEDAIVELVKTNTVVGMDTYKRSLSFLMVKAVSDCLLGKSHQVKVQYAINSGLYCDLDGAEVTDELIQQVKARMLELVDANLKIKKESVGTDEAIKRFAAAGMKGKEKLFGFRRVSKVNIYSLGDYEDYFYGYMVPSTGYLKVFDLIAYEKGFMLLTPGKADPSKVREFKDQKKLFQVFKKSEEWCNLMNINNVGDLNEVITRGEMDELMLVQEALMEKQIGEIADKIKAGGKKIVLIAGPSSSGKTTFSHRLSVQLRAHGLRPYPLALDNYFKERDETPKDENGKYDFECIEAMDLELFNNDMTRLLNGEEIEIPTFNFTIGTKEYKGKKLKLNDGDVLVCEGIHGLNPQMTAKLPDESKFKIYISALTQLNIDGHNRIPTTDGRLLRRIVRDARTRGADAKRTIGMWESVRRGEEKYIFPFQEQADVMFNSAIIYELGLIKQYAEPLLFAVPHDCEEYQEAKRLLKFLDYFLNIDPTNIPKNSVCREFVGGGCFDI